ncbi:hypothetical protein M231_05644 [Tremella mesenterica]|uniref:histidine kinase n=1 Tax=Tremella mesenterica TaxID=5217 RepID=A0A4Q1BHH5_TREME|nr:hypothetical protein M231_05644 [Tremella mesenterica]
MSSGDPTRKIGKAPSPGPSRAQVSSAAFLHHLHTDPNSHHITLSAAGGRHGLLPSRSPPPMTVSLETGNAEQSRSGDPPSQSPSNSPVAAPKLSSPLNVRTLSRGSFRRGRPSTAPGRHLEESASRVAEYPSPDMLDVPLLSDPLVIPPGLQAIAASDDACLSQVAQDEIDAATNALGVVSLQEGTDASGRKVVGRSGTLGEWMATPRSRTNPETTKRSPSDVMNWSTFAEAYSFGLFDPNRIPMAPVPTAFSSVPMVPARSSPGQELTQPSSSDSSGALSTRLTASSFGSSGGSSGTTFSSAPTTSTSSGTHSTSAPLNSSMAAAMAARKAFELESIPRTNVDPPTPVRPDRLALPSYSFAAATVRMAANSFRDTDIAPFGAPSPERELLDPLSSVMSPSNSAMSDSASSDPGASRFPLSRSVSSAYTGRTRDENYPPYHLPTIKASPVSTPDESSHHGKLKENEGNAGSPNVEKKPPSPTTLKLKGGVPTTRIPPASAPLEKVSEAEPVMDYFGSAAPRAESSSSSSQTVTEKNTPFHREINAEAAPARQPLSDFQLPPVATPSDLETIYHKVGWLPAPMPPNEAARRRALYRFNILHTAADVNFDRIAHLTKLVFNPKMVLIVLMDGERQWHKTHASMGAEEAARISSFCGHAVLGRTDEPFVVLDSHLDWRFKKNPQVVGPPYVRFYAGAPLRTAEGHNVGTLCIIDDKPRTEFPPRSRLILKEFAAVTMREMELWRDKLQLRVRDRIQTAMEEFTRECLEMDAKWNATNTEAAASMDVVYARATQLVTSALGLDGCFILDISQFEMIELEDSDGSKRTIYRADPYGLETHSPVLERHDNFGPVAPLPVFASTHQPMNTREMTPIEHEKMSDFLLHHRDGRIFEDVAPSWIRYMLPSTLRYVMCAPIIGINKQPVAMICAYTSNKAKQSLEGYELQFLRAIGIIILSAVLRRRMVMADKTKSILISSVSHELRTPLHGILASAELLEDTKLDSNQISSLETVKLCGTALIETVNHVLDFTKLAGSAGSSGSSPFKPVKANLALLVEQTVEGCWVGQRARLSMDESDIGSYYAPPSSATGKAARRSQREAHIEQLAQVETVVDIAQRERGWIVKFEKSGLRRVLMNLVGNSLKFTEEGYVQITLRELPHSPGATKIPVELAVIDTGKGIGKEFLKDQLFQPFSQENPLQTGTGLGLAIVNSIVRSDTVAGKVDVWSSEGVGTEIRVSFEVEVVEEDDETDSVVSSAVSSFGGGGIGRGRSISFVSFDVTQRGQALVLDVLASYAMGMQFDISDSPDIFIVNEDFQWLRAHVLETRPIIFLLARRTAQAIRAINQFNENGGQCRIVYKPVGPAGFKRHMQETLATLEDLPDDDCRSKFDTPTDEKEIEDFEVDRPTMSREDTSTSQESTSTVSELTKGKFQYTGERVPLQRRRSEEQEQQARPAMAPRGVTYHNIKSSTAGKPDVVDSPLPGSPNSSLSTISLADGGVMLKAATLPAEAAPKRESVVRVMVVEDNAVNQKVLGAYLKKRGIEYGDAWDGKAGVELFEETPANYWDVILMDISMPIMNGHEATRAIRKIEDQRRAQAFNSKPVSGLPPIPSFSGPRGGASKMSIPPAPVLQARVKIFALTGLATADDKREAFISGVDGYLVKPVSFVTLDVIFKSEFGCFVV